MKVGITGASNFVNRMFEACGKYQWAREFLKNSLEADATRVEFGIEWQAVDKLGVYRRTIADNGIGMSSKDLLDFFSKLGIGGKQIGGVHDNFGVGAKIAALPWNADGLVILSFKDGKASMIKIVLEPETNEYELVEFDTGSSVSCVIDPTTVDWGSDIDWGAVAAEWVRRQGTVVVLLGSEEAPDTVLGNVQAEEADIKGLSVYLNTRFWDLTQFEIHVAELRSPKKNAWPLGPDDNNDARRANKRRIMGAKHFIESVTTKDGKLASTGTLFLDNERVLVDWSLWEGERPAIHSYAKKQGYIAVRYRDELFELSSRKPEFRAFGIIESQVQKNLTIVLEPQLYDPHTNPWGVHPDQSRNRLIFTGNGEKGVAMPMSDWGIEFADNLPEQIREAIRKARGDIAGTIDDDEYRRRLQDKFGSRWAIKRLVAAKPENLATSDATISDEKVETFEERSKSGHRRRRRGKKRRAVQHVQILATPGGKGDAVEADVPADVPHYRYASREEFDNEWHLAMWCPYDTAGPTVVLNQDAPILQEAVKHHRDQYPDVHAEEIGQIVMQVYGEIAVAKIAHSQKLTARIAEQELDQHYRSEQALTLALMGLVAEETMIAQRLGKLGRKKVAA